MTARAAGAACVAFLLISCGSHEPRVEDRIHPETIAGPAIVAEHVDSAGTGRVLRLVEAITEMHAQDEDQILRLPLDAASSLKARDTGSVLRFTWNTDIAGTWADEARIRMRVSRGDEATLQWKTEPGAGDLALQGVSVPIRPGDEARTYTIPLGGGSLHWRHAIRQIVLQPSDLPAEVEILSVELVHVPHHAPRRVTLAGETREVVPGPFPTWSFVVPPGGRFDAAVAAVPGFLPADGASRATVSWLLEVDGEPDLEVARQEFDPSQSNSFAPARADLSRWAGRRATLRAEVTDESAFWWGGPAVHGHDPEGPGPVVLISIDTLRADHLSCYGYERETSPHLDRFARDDAVVFENAFSEETYTLPAHMTLLTGLFPTRHRVDPYHPLRESETTLAERMREAGYLTAAFTGAKGWLRPGYGFAQGFDLYQIPAQRRRAISETHRQVEGWLDDHAGAKPFLFIHDFDVHGFHHMPADRLPYGPSDPAFLHFSRDYPIPRTLRPSGLEAHETWEFFADVYEGERSVSEEERVVLTALYDDAIRSVDHAIHELFESLRRRGLYDAALIVVTSDHGESLGEHDLYGHGWVYEPSAHIPLLVKFPGRRFAGTRSSALVELADVFPTVLDAIGSPPLEDRDGMSLLGLLEQRLPPRRFVHTRRQEAQSVRNLDWKLIVDRDEDTRELFEVARDTGELHDVHARQPPILSGLAGELERFYEVDPGGWHVRWTRSAQTEDVPVNLRVAAPTSLIRTERLLGDRREWLDNITIARHRLDVELSRTNREELILAQRDPDEPLWLGIESDRAFELILGHGPARTLKLADLPLVATAEMRVEPETPPAGSRSTIQIWYIPQGERTEAPVHDLTEEEREQLRSLGYVR